MTARIASGRGVPATRPNSTSTAMRSSVDVGLKRVRARQVDEIERHAAERTSADAALDRDPGIVRRALPQAGQPVEHRALAGVRIADDGDRARRAAVHGDPLDSERRSQRALPLAAARITWNRRACCAPQRDRGAIDPKLERIAAERAAQERELRALDEAEHHQPLHGGVRGLDRLDTRAITGFQIGQRQTVGSARRMRK